LSDKFKARLAEFIAYSFIAGLLIAFLGASLAVTWRMVAWAFGWR